MYNAVIYSRITIPPKKLNSTEVGFKFQPILLHKVGAYHLAIMNT